MRFSKRVLLSSDREEVTEFTASVQAVEAWMSSPPGPPADTLDSMRGSLKDFDFERWRREERELERSHEKRMGLVD